MQNYITIGGREWRGRGVKSNCTAINILCAFYSIDIQQTFVKTFESLRPIATRIAIVGALPVVLIIIVTLMLRTLQPLQRGERCGETTLQLGKGVKINCHAINILCSLHRHPINIRQDEMLRSSIATCIAIVGLLPVALIVVEAFAGRVNGEHNASFDACTQQPQN